MNRNYLSAALAGTAIVSTIVMTQTQPTFALTGVEINNIAREVTVLIKDPEGEGHGSGVIIAKEGNTYYVLTANHVVSYETQYNLVTGDKQGYAIDYSKIQRLNGVDLAIVPFTSDKDYRIAKLANTNTVQQGQSVFISGWPATSQSIQEVTRQFTSGIVSSLLEQPRSDGYALVYDSVTRRGMSGGPVFDSEGRVIAIHGLGDAETRDQVQSVSPNAPGIESVADLIGSGFNLGIPITIYLQTAPGSNIFLTVQVENTPVQQAVVDYTPPAQPDPRDTMNINQVFSNINEGLNTINRGVDTFRRVCGFFGCR
ncbi:serine protease [Roseofilum sp. BLCC_M91]|uniref:Serine protease n=1 Tax=Roseofilum halophilum BLCC-M91 TaxID=3022259 RepID=A0ABT7BMY0_9CYAN|nr:serine protease [Roseofilum halophilum]MDJ1180440.1 serine protease [Roseofilum halophilum BLCC-M91]